LLIKKAAVLCLAMSALAAPRAYAQMKWTDQGFVNATVGAQTGSHSLITDTSFDLFDEQARVVTTQSVKGGGLFDITAGYKVWGDNLVAALGYSRSSSNADGRVEASIPDPGVFDRPRSVTASAPHLDHTENAINLMAVWMVPVTDKIDVGVSAGPTIFFVNQDLPDTLSTSEPGPTVTGLTTKSVSKTAGGINLGVDVTYLLTKRWGVGGLARYTWGSVDLDGTTDSLTVGGFQIGVGARMRF
jgi:hypothetical protein